MSRPSGVDSKTRKDILNRYGDCCIKCGRRKYLEIHHITLMVNNGKDNYFNLVPLCRECHRFAPDDYIEFLKYLGSRYNPHFDMIR
jgi:5-methylcytosine-specific restriction endonuclease McrA